MAFTFTDANAAELIASGQPVVIDFWGTNCGPCRAMAPAIDEVAAKYEGKVLIGKYNVEEESDLSVQYRIMAIPTILFFKDGKKTPIRLVGGHNADEISAKVEELLSL